MKKMKKTMALLLSLLMVLSMGMVTFAAKPGNLTVKGQGEASLKGQTVFAFKLFDLVQEDPAEYSVNTSYVSALNQALGTDYEDSYDLYSAVAALKGNSSEVQNFADKFTTAVIDKVGEENKDYWKKTVNEDTNTCVFEGLQPGYYLVYLGTSTDIQSSLKNVVGDTTVNLKTQAPVPEKEADQEDVQVGDVVTYTVTTKIPDTTAYDNYVFKLHDTLSDGLDFSTRDGEVVTNGSIDVSVQVPETADAVTLPAMITGKKMTLDLSSIVSGNQDKKGQEITITYYAKVNANAKIDNTENSATLEYSNDPTNEGTGTSVPDIVKTPTFALYIHKFEKGKDNEYLANAEFKLSRDVDGKDVIKVTGDAGQYVVAEDQNTGSERLVTTAAGIDGKKYNLQINGLKAGTYYLTETKAPSEDYNILTAPVKIEIENTTKPEDETPSCSIRQDGEKLEDSIVDIVNSKGTLLPETGGMGTIFFTIAGIALIVGVGASFVISRRKRTK